jgi:hypothetical protein
MEDTMLNETESTSSEIIDSLTDHEVEVSDDGYEPENVEEQGTDQDAPDDIIPDNESDDQLDVDDTEQDYVDERPDQMQDLINQNKELADMVKTQQQQMQQLLQTVQSGQQAGKVQQQKEQRFIVDIPDQIADVDIKQAYQYAIKTAADQAYDAATQQMHNMSKYYNRQIGLLGEMIDTVMLKDNPNRDSIMKAVQNAMKSGTPFSEAYDSVMGLKVKSENKKLQNVIKNNEKQSKKRRNKAKRSSRPSRTSTKNEKNKSKEQIFDEIWNDLGLKS